MIRNDERSQRGQSTVEFALIIPLVFVVLMAVVQVCLVAYAQLAVTHVAREAARTLAVDPTADIGHLVEETATLGRQNMVIEVFFEPSAASDRETVTVSVSYQTPPIIGVFSGFSDQFIVKGEVRMVVEPG